MDEILGSGNGDFVEINGATLEGGGQILRSSVSLSAIIQKPIRVVKIRAGRSNPGLRYEITKSNFISSNQHLAGLELAARLCSGVLSSCAIGSSEVSLIPKTISGGYYEADAKTAGSISLILQVATPILAFAKQPSELLLKGGTDALYAPPINYMDEVALHYFKKMGIDYRLNIIKRGFYPQGGGVVKTVFTELKSPLSPIVLLDSGCISSVSGYAFVAGRVPIKIAYEMKNEAVKFLKKYFTSLPINIDVFQEDHNRSSGNIATFMLVANTSTDCRLAASGISNPRGLHHSQLVAEACQKLLTALNLGVCCDDYMQDQLIVPMALAKGRSQIRCGPLTMHTKTVIYVAESMLPVKFEITEQTNGSCIVSCDGIGYFPQT